MAFKKYPEVEVGAVTTEILANAPTITNPNLSIIAPATFMFKYPSISVIDAPAGEIDYTVQNAYNGNTNLVVGDVITLSGASFVGPISGTLSNIPFTITAIADIEQNAMPYSKKYSLVVENTSDIASITSYATAYGLSNPGGITASGTFNNTVSPSEILTINNASSNIQDQIASLTNSLQTTNSNVSAIPVPSISEISWDDNVWPNGKYFVNTSAARTYTLPSSPTVGDEIQFFDATGTAGTNNITISRNGNKINGIADNALLDADGVAAVFIYTGSTYGWRMG